MKSSELNSKTVKDINYTKEGDNHIFTPVFPEMDLDAIKKAVNAQKRTDISNANSRDLFASRLVLVERLTRCSTRSEMQPKVDMINLLTFEIYKRTYATFEKPNTRLNAFALFRSFGDDSCGVPDELEECFLKLKDAFDYMKKEKCLFILSSDEWEHLFNVSEGLTVIKMQRTRVNT